MLTKSLGERAEYIGGHVEGYRSEKELISALHSDLISKKSLLDKLDPLYKQKKETAPNNLAEGFMQVANLIKWEPSAFERMTYGEVIQALFPIERIYKEEYVEVVFKGQHHTTYFTLDFWDSTYQKGE